MIKQFLRNTFPPDLFEDIKVLYNSLLRFFLKVFSYNGYTSSLYYFLFSSKFHREQMSVLKGRLKYLQGSEKNQQPRYLLRRNIHRLEKGILMRPRKSVFGTSYINETVDAYHNCISAEGIENIDFNEIQWANDVLTKYFDVVDSDTNIDRAKIKFEQINGNPINLNEIEKVPYKVNLEAHQPVNFEDFLSLVKHRKSVRWYLKKNIPREEIDKALLAASMAPSACNRQPYEFRVFDHSETVKKIASLPWGTAGFVDNIPAIMVIVGKLEAFFDERDRHLIYIDASLSAMSFILALETMGISSCALNWPDVKEAEQQINRALNLEPNERVIMLLAFGYPDPEGQVAYSQKKSLDELRQYQ